MGNKETGTDLESKQKTGTRNQKRQERPGGRLRYLQKQTKQMAEGRHKAEADQRHALRVTGTVEREKRTDRQRNKEMQTD
jgi:hypothetical protein